ncbi:MAG: nuclear transport factor 2 family protein [Candidatus Nanohalobium sp.]
MAQIQDRLNQFKKCWKKGDIDKVLNLFTEDVEYWEAPSQKPGPEELRHEWESVMDQEDIELETEVFSSQERKHTVQWKLSYVQEGERTELDGFYLIKLNSEGKCYEFWQYCQLE